MISRLRLRRPALLLLLSLFVVGVAGHCGGGIQGSWLEVRMCHVACPLSRSGKREEERERGHERARERKTILGERWSRNLSWPIYERSLWL